MINSYVIYGAVREFKKLENSFVFEDLFLVVNPIQYGGGLCAPCRFFLYWVKTVCSKKMKLSDF